MKVILIQNVPSIGNSGDIKNVSPGYARNFLIPKGLAKIASETAVQNLQRMRAKESAKANEKNNKIKESIGKIEGQQITIQARANDEGKLFASLNRHDISQYIEQEAGVEIDEKYINLEDPIKTLGTHEIKISTPGAVSSITINVNPQ